ncbi:dipeptidyl peptidase III [Apiosordaria backusii]|uniref:Dipeptidyl peptidase III n=1 Tax=Apiosordaria backusii TaxID=314023 RepID=A0AA40K666_9PEZI|nr:dipeptidyl peptidase III [Apiosordaria backusii]
MAATYQLHIKDIFDGLGPREKLYSHHLARAAWQGSRIVLRQTSPESEDIFDFILGLHKACGGQWSKLIDEHGVRREDVDCFLDYAGQFLAHLGNYYVSLSADGNRKVVPRVSADALRKMASISLATTSRLEKILGPLLAVAPYSLGFPGPSTQSAYYPGPEIITKDEIAAIAEIMEKHSIDPENTRLRKTVERTAPLFHILQASAESSPAIAELPTDNHALTVRITPGDHAAELSKVCAALKEAAKYTSNDTQVKLLHEYIESFNTGSTKAYRRSQKTWVTDLSPRVENIFGFVEPYRDPYGVRAEWEGIVSISDPDETRKLAGLVSASAKVISLLPWAVADENDGKGPFEASLFQAPDFAIVHALAYCASVVWDGVNLPNYSDIRETCGLKNILFWNRMAIRVESHPPSRHVHSSEAEPLKSHSQMVNFVTTSIHELIGHGSGKLLSETAPNIYNFDNRDLPMNPLTGKAIESWYKLGQTWTGVFGKLATTVEECRATLISYYLADEKDVLRLFGLEDENTVADFIYYVYLTIGVRGIDALASFNAEDQSWGDQHARGAFVILRHLLLDGGDVITVNHSPATGALHVHVNRSKILSHGKPSLGRLLLRLHLWRCTADIKSCKEFYEPLSTVDGQFETWRQTAVAAWSDETSSLVQSEPGSKIVQPNTFMTEDGRVELKVYDATNEGIIQSFLDRSI